MAFPIVQGRATGRDVAAVANHPIVLPAGITVGELLQVVFSCDSSVSTSVGAGSGAGWTKLDQGTDANSAVSGSIFYKTADGSDTLFISSGTSREASHASFRISGFTSPPTGSKVGSGFGGSTNTNPPSHAPGLGSQDFLWIATRSGDAQVVATAAPAGYSNLQTIAANTASGASTNTAELSANAATEDPGTFTSATENWVSFTIAIEPAASGSGLSVVRRRPSPNFRR